MKKQLSNISVYQSSKLFSMMFFIVAAILAVPASIVEMVTEGVAGVAILLLPFLVALVYFLVYAVIFLLYNFTAKHFGGLEFTFKDVE